MLRGAHSGPHRERRPPPGKVRFRRARRRPPAPPAEPSPDSFAAMEPGRASPTRQLSPGTRSRVELASPRQAALLRRGPPAPAPCRRTGSPAGIHRRPSPKAARHFRVCRVRWESPPAAEPASPAARVDRRSKRNPWPGYAREGSPPPAASPVERGTRRLKSIAPPDHRPGRFPAPIQGTRRPRRWPVEPGWRWRCRNSTGRQETRGP